MSQSNKHPLTLIPTAVASHLAVIDGQATTTTQNIAEVYGKRHDDVLRLVRQRITEAGEWGVRNFTYTPYTNPQNGQTYPVIRMTKKGFHFVVGKFTGAKAVRHQIAFADEFERLEKQLHGGNQKIDPGALLLEGQMMPTLQLPESVQKAIDQRAWELVGQAHELIREHLRRRATSHGECGHPTRRINEGRALEAIARGDLGDALTHAWQQKMGWLIDAAEIHAIESAKFLQKVKQGRLAP